MTHEQAPQGDTATETHHEPHGAASPHGAADDVPAREQGGGNRVGQDGHGSSAHGDAAGHDAGGHDAHDAHGEALGPIDAPAWAAGAVGILLGLVVVACMWAATRGLGAA